MNWQITQGGSAKIQHFFNFLVNLFFHHVNHSTRIGGNCKRYFRQLQVIEIIEENT
jgi:hypothetical protein